MGPFMLLRFRPLGVTVTLKLLLRVTAGSGVTFMCGGEGWRTGFRFAPTRLVSILKRFLVRTQPVKLLPISRSVRGSRFLLLRAGLVKRRGPRFSLRGRLPLFPVVLTSFVQPSGMRVMLHLMKF